MAIVNFVVTLEKMTGKGRPRFSRKGGFMRAYTPPETKAVEDKIATVAKNAMHAAGIKMFKNAVKMEIEAGYVIPKATSKKLKEQMLDDKIKPTVKPDADNVAKLVADALNGIMYNDDNQIVVLNVEKKYTETKPYLRINVSDEIKGDDWQEIYF